LLGREFLSRGTLGQNGSADGAGSHSVYEIAPGDLPAHAKIAIASV
jgi:hypothetical protein